VNFVRLAIPLHEKVRRVLGLCAVAICLVPAARAGDESLARYAPAEVGFFVELRDSTDLMLSLTEPQIWTALAEFAGQPAQPEDAAEWSRRIQQTVRMPPDEAIRLLFSRAVAFVGEGPGRSQDAVVLAQPAKSPREIVAGWKPQRLKDFRNVATFHLHSGLGVVELPDALAFGDLVPATGLFRRVIADQESREPQRLTDDAVFRGLRKRLPERVDGLLFARLVPEARGGRGPASASSRRAASRDPLARELPGPLSGADNLMVAMQRDKSMLRFTLVGDGEAPARSSSPRRALLIDNLPQSTLVAWEGGVESRGLLEAIHELPERNPLRLALALVQPGGAIERLTESLGSGVLVAVGSVAPAGRPEGTPPMPAVALIAPVKDPQAAATEMRNVVDALAALFNISIAVPQQQPAIPEISTVELLGGKAFVLDLSQFVKKVNNNAIGELHLAWAVQDDRLIVATHLDWVRQILVAGRSRDAGLGRLLRAIREDIPTAAGNIVCLQSGALADLASQWLAYFERTAPEAMKENFWRSRTLAGSPARLGIDLERTDQPRRMRVKAVSAGMPGDGRVLVGDVLLGCDAPFQTDEPWLEFRKRIDERPHASYIDLILERAGNRRVVRVPVPYLDPIQGLRRVAAVGRVMNRALYFDDRPEADGPRGFLGIQLQPDRPASAPASAAAR
jgi:hypothetical protein